MSNTYGGKFCSPDERQITTIGTGYVANFLSSAGESFEQAGATLTNKRIYFSGKTFSVNDKGQISSAKQRKIVNVRDVTGVGYIQFSTIQYLAYSILAFVGGNISFALTGQSRSYYGGWEPSSIGNVSLAIGILASIVFIALYFLQRLTLFSIEYAGGNIAFDARWIQSGEEDTFIRNIHLTKDKLYSTAAVEQGFVDDDDIPEL